MKSILPGLLAILICVTSCRSKTDNVQRNLVAGLNLKTGSIVSCGPPDQELGTIAFNYDGSPALKTQLSLGIKLLHSFEYDEAEKAFAQALNIDPECMLGYWGVAMANFHPLWAEPLPDELEKGAKAVALGRKLKPRSEKEEAYLGAIGSFYDQHETLDHRTRTRRFEEAMAKFHEQYPADDEVTIFYALALTAAADPADKTYAFQRKAGAILEKLYAKMPNHPGVVHYLIHAYDTPELASGALDAARHYASVAPSSAHALHMPSHIFTRLGLWQEGAISNASSLQSAVCYAEQTGIKGHWDEELHAIDYLVYSYLQMGKMDSAQVYWDYLNKITVVTPTNFKVAYAFASVPSRMLLEQHRWKEAANLEGHVPGFEWGKYQLPNAILHFTRLLGSVQTGQLDKAHREQQIIDSLCQALVNTKNNYIAAKVLIQSKCGKAWILQKEGHNDQAIALMREAADLEDRSEKLPISPGDVLPAREMLGDLLLACGQAEEAVTAYQQNLKLRPGRLNGLQGLKNAGLQLKK